MPLNRIHIEICCYNEFSDNSFFLVARNDVEWKTSYSMLFLVRALAFILVISVILYLEPVLVLLFCINSHRSPYCCSHFIFFPIPSRSLFLAFSLRYTNSAQIHGFNGLRACTEILFLVYILSHIYSCTRTYNPNG